MGLRRDIAATIFLALAVLLLSDASEAKRHPVRVFRTTDGLPSDEISFLFEDSRGFLWIGTSNGLSRFDGRKFRNYGVREGFPAPYASHMAESPDGTLWIAAWEGVARMDPSRGRLHAEAGGRPTGNTDLFRFYRLKPPDGGANVAHYLYADRRGRIWAGTARGLFVLDSPDSDFRRVPIDDPRNDVHFVSAASIAEYGDGTIWVGTAWGLYRVLPDGRIPHYTLPPSVKSRGVRSIVVDRDGRLWLAGDQGEIVVFVAQRASDLEAREIVIRGSRRCDAPSLLPKLPGESCTIHTSEGLPTPWCDLFENARGNLFCVGPSGLTEVTGGRPQRIDVSFGPEVLSCGLEDRLGNLWIGTEAAGLLRITRTGTAIYSKADGLANDHVVSVFEDGDRNLYAVSSGWAVHRFVGDRFVAVYPARPPQVTIPGWGWDQYVLRDHLGEWWYPTAQGLLRYGRGHRLEDLERTRPRLLTKKHGLAGNQIFRLFEDSRGDVWIGTVDAERITLSRWNRKTESVTSIPLPTPFSENPPTAFVEDHAGDVWIGFYGGGLTRYDHATKRFLCFPPGGPVPEGLVRDLLVDVSGRLWIATTVGGLAFVREPAAQNPVFQRYGLAEGLPESRILALAEDGHGRLYVATSRGIHQLDQKTRSARLFSTSEGLISGAVVAAFRDHSGRLWFGTTRGLYLLDPETRHGDTPPRVYLDSIDAGGRHVPVDERGERSVVLPDLAPSRNFLSVEFLSPNLAADESVTFRYHLEGSKGGWSAPLADRSLQLASLSPGRYRLLIDAIDSAGRHSVEPAGVQFRILPPLWRRGWFELLVALAIACLLALLYRMRVARLLEMERVRSRIAADLHDDLGTSLYRISILSELARRQVSQPEKDPRPLLSEIGETARGLIESAGDMVWSVDPRRDDLGSLAARIRHYAAEILEVERITWSLDGPEGAEQTPLGAEQRRDIYLIFKEAIRNAVRHGRPSRLTLWLGIEGGAIAGEIRDDGSGFVPDRDGPGDGGGGIGLRSMQERAENLGGELEVESSLGRGTRVRVTVPLGRRA